MGLASSHRNCIYEKRSHLSFGCSFIWAAAASVRGDGQEGCLLLAKL